VNLASIVDPHPADRVALVSRGRTTTYGELRDEVARLRGGLAGLGLRPGDRVALAVPNNAWFARAYLGVLGAGLVAVPLNPASPAAELRRELGAVRASALVVGPTAAAAVGELDRSALPDLAHLVALPGVDLPGAVAADDLLAADPAPLVDRAGDDLAVLMFTSGTAGAPRAAMLTHGNLLANLEQVQGHPGRSQHPDDVTFGVLPLFHIFGLNVVLGLTLYAGSQVVLVERFDPASALETIVRHRITVVPGAPTMWMAWAALPDADPDALRTVRLAASGAAKLPVETARAVEARFGVRVTEGYGLTEASPVVTTSAGQPPRPGSIGVLVPRMEMRLVDSDGEDALVGDAGEIWVRGPNVFAGYWEDPEATAAVLTADGWLRTGDVAVVDDDGWCYLVDRAKDLIIVSGFNVFPAEVEDVIAAHPAVAGVAVVGVPHPYQGETVKAVVVLREGANVEEDDLIRWCEQRIARYKCPTKVMFVDELPVGAGGKVLRRALRAS
jgi:long-chain acyl-CoA synthetase